MKKGSIILFIFLVFMFGAFYYLKTEVASVFNVKIVMDNSKSNDLLKDSELTGYDLSNPFASKYYFNGKDVNNYFIHDNLCYRIVNITSANYIKMVYVGRGSDDCSNITSDLQTSIYDSESSDFEDSFINSSLISMSEKDSIMNNETSLYNYMVDALWSLGGIKMTGSSLQENIMYERNELGDQDVTYRSRLGLISVTDYLKAGCSKSVYDAIENCGDDNFLYNDFNFFTMNSILWDDTNVYAVLNGMPTPTLVDKEDFYFQPSFYLKDSLTVKGDGSVSNPYRLK